MKDAVASAILGKDVATRPSRSGMKQPPRKFLVSNAIT